MQNPNRAQSMPKKSLLVLFLSIGILMMSIYLYTQKSNEIPDLATSPRDVIEPGEVAAAVTEEKTDQFQVQTTKNEEARTFESILPAEITDRCRQSTCVVSVQVATEDSFMDIAGSEFNLESDSINSALSNSELAEANKIRFKISVLGEMAAIDAVYYSEVITLN